MKRGTRHAPEALARLRAARVAQLERDGGTWNKGLSTVRSEDSRRKQAKTVKAKWADLDWRAARGKTVIAYAGMHMRLNRLAKKVQTCRAHEVDLPRCNQLAADWAIKHDRTENLLHDPKGRPYSMNVDDYVRLCRSCHNRYDENMKHSWKAHHDVRVAAIPRGEEHWKSKLKEEDIATIKARRTAGETLSRIAADYRVAVSTIWKIVHEKSWTPLDKNEEEE